MIFTGCYFDVVNLKNLGWKSEDLIGISRSKFIGVENYCDELKPWYSLFKDYMFFKKNYNGLMFDDYKIKYEKKFKRYLMSLDVDKFGKQFDGKILLCFEKSGEFCHRNFIRDWFNYYGYHCIELWYK